MSITKPLVPTVISDCAIEIVQIHITSFPKDAIRGAPPSMSLGIYFHTQKNSYLKAKGNACYYACRK